MGLYGMWARRLIAGLILIKAFVPGDVPDKATVADKLREAARMAGCKNPIAEVESPDMQSFEITVWCRDEERELH